MNRFQWITEDSNTLPRPDFDRPLSNTKNFEVLASLGSLVPGWLLVVPKRKMQNLSFLNKSEKVELKEISQKLSLIVGKNSKYTFHFEHGSHYGSEASCGVDQAHLHIVPLNFNLFDKLSNNSQNSWIKLLKGEVVWGNPQEKEYLTLSNFEGSSIITFPKEATSQWFRRLIAESLGCPERWDYKSYPELQNINLTQEMFN